MRSIKEFSKLFKINIPYEKEFNYYIDTLSKSNEFSDLHLLVDEFKKFEDSINEPVASYKMKQMDKILDFIRNTKTYCKFNTLELPKHEYMTVSKINDNVTDETFFVSFDIVRANHSTLQSLDEDGELSGNWEDFCLKQNVHLTLAKSKSFRQLIYGNLNPSRNQKFQHVNMIKLYNHILNNVGFNSIVFLSCDELVLKFEALSELYNVREVVADFIKNNKCPAIKETIFKLEKIGKNAFVKTVYGASMEEKFETLVGIPGNLFYLNFKKHILNEEPEERDLYFVSDNKLAKWMEPA